MSRFGFVFIAKWKKIFIFFLHYKKRQNFFFLRKQVNKLKNAEKRKEKTRRSKRINVDMGFTGLYKQYFGKLIADNFLKSV